MEIDKLLVNLVDLHQHLSFSSTPHFLWELAHEQGIRLKEKDYWRFITSITVPSTTSQEHYHNLYDMVQLIQSSPYGVEKAMHHAVSHSYRKSNITKLEIRFNPMRRNRGGEHDLDKIILSALVGMKKACLEYPVKAGLIIELDRRFSKEQNEILAKKAITFKNEGVIGIDLSGPENKNFKVNDIVKAYDMAREAGLGLTVHTGELPPVEEMNEAIEKLHPQRIGHGIQAVHNKKVMEALAEKNIILEICPSSNMALRLVKDWQEFKQIFETLREHKVNFTINSDSPTMIHTNVKEELRKIYENKILTLAQIKECIALSINSSFIKN